MTDNQEKKDKKITITDEEREKIRKYRLQLYIKKKPNMNEADAEKLKSQWRASYTRKKIRSVEHIEHMPFQMKNYCCNFEICVKDTWMLCH